jgi:hypothetical protein
MKQLLREPLLHFLVLGAVLFAAASLAGGQKDRGQDQIVVTPERIAHLATGFSRSRSRQPTTEEMRGLIQDHVREEVYYREAKAMGLDRDDVIIRRRLRQKLEFVSDDVASLTEPTDADLAAFLDAHPDRFRLSRRMTFRHVYLSPERHQGTLDADAARLLADLQTEGATADTSKRGDPFLLQTRFDGVAADEVAKLFGETFAARLGEIAPSQWHGPIASGYGVHLVFIDDRIDGRVLSLTEASETVRRDWLDAQRKKTNEEFFAKLLGRYVVTIHDSKADGAGATHAAWARQ